MKQNVSPGKYPVKGMRSGHRLLDVLEAVAGQQPVGVSDLARAIGEGKSTVQRMLTTLADAGWIRPAPGPATKWEMSGRIHIVAQMGQGVGALCRRARRLLAELRDATGETVVLALREKDGLVIAEVAESPREWRLVPRIGNIVPDRPSASALAIAPFVAAGEQAVLLAGVPDTAMVALLADIGAQGFAVQESERGGGSVNIAAPVFDAGRAPIATVVLTAPATRLLPEGYAAMGRRVAAAAERLSAF